MYVNISGCFFSKWSMMWSTLQGRRVPAPPVNVWGPGSRSSLVPSLTATVTTGLYRSHPIYKPQRSVYTVNQVFFTGDKFLQARFVVSLSSRIFKIHIFVASWPLICFIWIIDSLFGYRLIFYISEEKKFLVLKVE